MIIDEIEALDWFILGLLLSGTKKRYPGGEYAHPTTITLSDIHDASAAQLSYPKLREHIAKLETLELIKQDEIAYDRANLDIAAGAYLTLKGIWFVAINSDRLVENLNQLLFSFPDEIGDAVASLLKGITYPEDENSIPASDRTVSLNHNSDEYRTAVASLDQAIEAYKNDHRHENEEGAEKRALIGALEAGRELLSDTKINLRTAIHLILRPLEIIRDKYRKYEGNVVGGVVGAATATAIALLMRLIGIT